MDMLNILLPVIRYVGKIFQSKGFLWARKELARMGSKAPMGSLWASGNDLSVASVAWSTAWTQVM